MHRVNQGMGYGVLPDGTWVYHHNNEGPWTVPHQTGADMNNPWDDAFKFVAESNRIEGILRLPFDAEIDEHQRFMALAQVNVVDLVQFVSVYQPGARLRDQVGLNVRVGDHLPPLGGPAIRNEVERILRLANDNLYVPFLVHCMYETVHPFTDGNGRSGRVLWAWHMQKYGGCPLGFLHHFYYQALQGNRP